MHAMSSLSRTRNRPSGLTLERAIFVALLVHVLGALTVQQWPELLIPAPQATAEAKPLEFRFVDSPDEVEPPVPPETEALSDRHRRAADDSPVDDREGPRSEGNTAQQVLRAPEPAIPTVRTPPAQPLTQPSEERTTEERTEEVAETGETAAERAEEEAAERAEETPAVQPAPASLPPRPQDLRRSLSRLSAFAEPQVYDNPEGGAPESRSLADFDTRGYDLGPYLRQVIRTIEANWRSNIPPLIRTGVGGATFVNLAIRRQRNDRGEEVAVIVAERTWTSGQPAYDSAALFSLELSSPLPPIPDYYPYEVITGRLGYIYNLPPERIPFPEDQ